MRGRRRGVEAGRVEMEMDVVRHGDRVEGEAQGTEPSRAAGLPVLSRRAS